MTKKTNLQIALAGFLAILISSASLGRVGLRYFISFIPPRAMVGIAIIYFATMLIILTVRIIRLKTPEQANRMLAFWQGALRYILALDLCIFGIGKFFHIQFNTPLGVLDNPFNTLSNDQLMWAFFGHSYVFTLIIGCMQIFGSFLLLFRKTRLVGVIFLLPMLINICMLDFFYNDLGTTIYSGIEIVGLAYLLFAEYDRLVKFFFVDKGDLPQFNFKAPIWRNVARASIIIIPLLLMALNKFPQYYPEINGKYEVKNIIINNRPRPATPCTDSILTRVYFDKNDLVLDYGSYKRRFIGHYTYNQATKQVVGTWRYPRNQHDTLYAQILPGSNPERKTLTGHMGKETFKIDMLRVDKGEHN